MPEEFETVIGLEVHAELSTLSKAFCGCSTKFGARQNANVCPVCMGLPGSLPVLNKKALEYAVRVACALGCKVARHVKFDRKNYFYPDLPKNFQISQYDTPLSANGRLDVAVNDNGREYTISVGITRVHLEEDAGKLVHPGGQLGGRWSLVDFNRSGIPLLEIVSEPDMRSPEEAHRYLLELKSILSYLEVSNCNMEEGSLRCDANISVRRKGETKLGAKTEIKNMNSFKGVLKALGYEAGRQAEVLKKGGGLAQGTRLWNADDEKTLPMRTKEEAQDYRYFPEPDLVPFVIEPETVEHIRSGLPELPAAKRKRFVERYLLPAYDAAVITADREMASFFEECAGAGAEPKAASNWLMGEVSNRLNEKNCRLRGLGLTPRGLAGLIKLVEDGSLNARTAKEVIDLMIETGKEPGAIMKERDLAQISGEGELDAIAGEVISGNGKAVKDYAEGKEQALKFLVGQMMKRTKGKANPRTANEILLRRLKNG